MSLNVIYAIFALVMGIVMIRMVPLYESGPVGVITYFILGVLFAPFIFLFFAGLLIIAVLQFIATVGRQE